MFSFQSKSEISKTENTTKTNLPIHSCQSYYFWYSKNFHKRIKKTPDHTSDKSLYFILIQYWWIKRLNIKQLIIYWQMCFFMKDKVPGILRLMAQNYQNWQLTMSVYYKVVTPRLFSFRFDYFRHCSVRLIFHEIYLSNVMTNQKSTQSNGFNFFFQKKMLYFDEITDYKWDEYQAFHFFTSFS